MELRDAPDIHVCTVLPGAVDTPLYQQGANFTGRAVRPIPPVYSAEKVAAALVDLTRHPRREIVVGAAARAGLKMHALAPASAERFFATQVEQKQFADEAKPSSEGNLFEPMEYERVEGGWRAAGKGGLLQPALLRGAALVAGLAFLVACGRRLRSRRVAWVFP